MSVVTIGEFILARLDDDEFLARHMVAQRGLASLDRSALACLGTWDPRRVLASCAAIRGLVLDHHAEGPDGSLVPCRCGEEPACAPCCTLRAVAIEWSAHPDYQAAWRSGPVPRQRRSA